MQRLLRLKLVYWLRWLKVFIRIIVFLIAVSIYYLAYVIWNSIMIATRTVIIVGSDVNQIYTGSQDTNCYTIQSSVIIIALGFIRILPRSLNTCFSQNNRLIISRLRLVFFFRRFGSFFFLIGLLVLLITSIYFSDIGKGLECSYEFGFNSFIKYFVPKDQFLLPIIYLNLNK